MYGFETEFLDWIAVYIHLSETEIWFVLFQLQFQEEYQSIDYNDEMLIKKTGHRRCASNQK